MQLFVLLQGQGSASGTSPEPHPHPRELIICSLCLGRARRGGDFFVLREEL